MTCKRDTLIWNRPSLAWRGSKCNSPTEKSHLRDPTRLSLSASQHSSLGMKRGDQHRYSRPKSSWTTNWKSQCLKRPRSLRIEEACHSKKRAEKQAVRWDILEVKYQEIICPKCHKTLSSFALSKQPLRSSRQSKACFVHLTPPGHDSWCLTRARETPWEVRESNPSFSRHLVRVSPIRGIVRHRKNAFKRNFRISRLRIEWSWAAI